MVNGIEDEDDENNKGHYKFSYGDFNYGLLAAETRAGQYKHTDIRVYSRPGETRFQVRLPIIYKEGLKQRYWSWIKP